MKPALRSFALCLTILAGASSALSGNAPGSGGPAKYTFRDPPLNSLGVKSLADLRGKPVLIDFWGKR